MTSGEWTLVEEVVPSSALPHGVSMTVDGSFSEALSIMGTLGCNELQGPFISYVLWFWEGQFERAPESEWELSGEKGIPG